MLHITFALIGPKVAGPYNFLDINSSFGLMRFLEKTTNKQSDAENKANVSRRLVGGM